MTNHEARTGRLLDLLEAIGPSGHEQQAATAWREQARQFSNRVEADATGNSYAWVAGRGGATAPRILLAGHIDEIGIVTSYIEEEGFLRVRPIGGVDPAVMVGQRVRLLGRDGPVPGVLARAATHLQTYEEQDAPIKIHDLWVDIGTNSAEETRTLLRVGDPGVIDVAPRRLAGNRLVARALDNRLGAHIVLEALRRYAESGGEATVIAVANTQEETLSTGAIVAANRTRPDAAVIVDLTLTSDHPELEGKRAGGNKLGDGAILCRGGVTSPVLFGHMERTALAHDIRFGVEAVGGRTGTDADAIAATGHGVAVAVASVPSRYMHSPNEMVDLDDVEAAIRLLHHTCEAVTATTCWER
jgi:putative aminopeptidase FrvX